MLTLTWVWFRGKPKIFAKMLWFCYWLNYKSLVTHVTHFFRLKHARFFLSNGNPGEVFNWWIQGNS